MAAAPAARKRQAQDEAACPTEEAGETKRSRDQLRNTCGHELLKDDGHPATARIKNLATEELAGLTSLRTRLITGPFSEDETRDSMRQLLRAVDDLHGAGTTHGGISPDNILVAPDGALEIISGSGGGKTCRPAVEEGAFRYRSPEQLLGFRCHEPEVDVWALGCVMAELLTGAPLFTAATEDDVITQTVELHDEIVVMEEEAFDSMMDLSLAGREVLVGLLAFHYAERLTAAAALEHRWFTEEDVEAKPAAVKVEAEHPALCPPSHFSEA